MLPKIVVDYGAIPFVLRGVNMAGVGLYPKGVVPKD